MYGKYTAAMTHTYICIWGIYWMSYSFHIQRWQWFSHSIALHFDMHMENDTTNVRVVVIWFANYGQMWQVRNELLYLCLMEKCFRANTIPARVFVLARCNRMCLVMIIGSVDDCICIMQWLLYTLYPNLAIAM